MMISHAEQVIGVVFHTYCRHPSDGGVHQTDGLGQNQLRDLKLKSPFDYRSEQANEKKKN